MLYNLIKDLNDLSRHEKSIFLNTYEKINLIDTIKSTFKMIQNNSEQVKMVKLDLDVK